MKPHSIVVFPNRALTFIREAREELKKVSWPSREDTIQYTLIVAISSVGVGLLIGGFDYLLTLFVETFLL